MKIEVEKETLLEVLCLVEDNNYISASSVGLKTRRENREKARSLLLGMLNFTEDDFGCIYNLNDRPWAN